MAKFARSIWNSIPDLTKQEIDTIERYEKGHRGTLFMNIADILRKRGFLDEAIVIMEDGIKTYPNYYTARAVLARDYYWKGLMELAKEQLQFVLEKDPQNLLALRLGLKVSLLLQDARSNILKILKMLKDFFPDDDFTKQVRTYIDAGNWQEARNLVIAELQKNAIPYTPAPTEQEPSSPAQKEQEVVYPTSGEDDWTIPMPRVIPLPQEEKDASSLPFSETQTNILGLGTAGGEQSFLSHKLGNVGEKERYLSLQNFRRIHTPGFFSRTYKGHNAAPLEGTTLAEIYVTQGLYNKAIKIYEKLLQENPRSPRAETFMQRIAYIRKLQEKQNERLAQTSPSHIDSAPLPHAMPTSQPTETSTDPKHLSYSESLHHPSTQPLAIEHKIEDQQPSVPCETIQVSPTQPSASTPQQPHTERVSLSKGESRHIEEKLAFLNSILQKIENINFNFSGKA